jgi:serine/threonine-protein kinase
LTFHGNHFEELLVSDVNRDLLLAALARLTDAVPNDVLQSTVVRWTRDPERSLAEHLKEAGIEERQLEALQVLVSTHLERHQGDLRTSLEAWNGEVLTWETITQLETNPQATTLAASLAKTLAMPLGATLTFAGAEAPPHIEVGAELPCFTQEQRFKLIERHARGGIGEVWRALDRELQREVAVKEIQARYVDRTDQRKRFLLEAEITGSLEHPGIVPVYSLGRNDRGRPFYAMRFIKGESLSVAIRKFHDRRRKAESSQDQRGTSWGVEFQQLLRRFLDVCDAMEYAHSRKVIHRDLKPANIMLGEYGETLVVDWGLAKILGQDDLDLAVPEPEDGEGLNTQTTGLAASVSGETQPGTTIGTPSYMSPEQARGDLENLGPSSDVYSLGATLYELLTGIFPFIAEKPQEIIDRVKKGALIPPRSLVSSIPAPLEAICLKAMAFTPAERYQSARELALDLEHWMADEPVAAYPEKPHQRASRWMRRHRNATAAGAATLLGITLVATVSLVVLDQARRHTEEARKEAETNFEIAQQAVDEYLTNVSENRLLKEQDEFDVGGLRKDLLRTAQTYYQRFLDQRSNDPKLRKNLANAQYRVGEITKEVASPKDALDAYRSALKLWEDLVKDDPDDPDPQFHLAETSLAIGRLQAFIGQSHDALAPLSRAREILQALVKRFPSDARYQSRLANCYSEIGLLRSDLETEDRGLADLERARAIQQSLIGKDPRNIEYTRNLAEIMNVLGKVYNSRADYPSSLACYQEVQRLCTSLIEGAGSGPKPIIDQELLALSYYNAGNIHVRNSEDKQALGSYQQALEYASALTKSHPSIKRFKEKQGYIYREIGQIQHREHQDVLALASAGQSKRIYQDLLQTEPDQAEYHRQLGLTWNFVGFLHDEARDNLKAIEPFQQAIAQQEQAIAKSKGINRDKFYLAFYLENLGEQHVDLGKVAEGLPWYEKAIQVRRELNKDKPDDREYAITFVKTLVNLEAIHRHDGNPTAALPLFAEATTVLDHWLKASTPDTEVQELHALLLNHQAAAQFDLGRAQEALVFLDQAIGALRSLRKIAPEDTQARELLSESIWDRARIHRSLFKSGEASVPDPERESLWSGRPPEELVSLAQKEAGQGNLIGYGKTPVTPQAEAVRSRDDERAAAHLRLARSRGLKDIEKLRSNPDLDLLLKRIDLDRAVPRRDPAARPSSDRP